MKGDILCISSCFLTGGGGGGLKRVLFADSEDPDEMQHNAAISSGSTLFVKAKRSSDKIIQYFPDTPRYVLWTIHSFFIKPDRLRAKKGPAPPPREFCRHILS